MSSAGRPRDERLTEQILAATLSLLQKKGYAGLTIDGVARAAGVTRATVYKRWRRLPDLVLDATLLARSASPQYATGGTAEPPDTGSLREDLRALVRDGSAVLDTLETGGLLRGLLADAMIGPDVAKRLTDVLIRPDEERYAVIFTRAVERGELARVPDPPELVPRTLLSYALFQRLVVGRVVTHEELDVLVDALLDGVRGTKFGNS